MTNNPLTELIPAQYRKYVYSVAAAAVFVYSIYLGTEGDWVAFAVALVSSLVPTLAASNTGNVPGVEHVSNVDVSEEPETLNIDDVEVDVKNIPFDETINY